MLEPRPAPDGEISAVLFDFAGTLLVPRAPDELVAGAARRAGIGMSRSELDELAQAYLAAGVPGAPYPRRVPEHLVELYGRRDLTAENHRGAYVGLFETVSRPRAGLDGLPEAVYEQILGPEGWVPYADAVKTVEAIAGQGVRVGLTSNVGFDIRAILRHHGFGRLADTCTLSFEVGCVKPDPRIFRIALERMGATASATLMVGDDERADGGARVLGMRTVILPMTEPGSVHGLGQVLELLDGGRADSG
ncbi:MAG TPA: HAD-IA family hydrolase [Solirubrobacteraceae bacterium]|jgi:HAD superfamily hydrolase (TIGR01509 family)|nr:HAD-IA family hydrolase [Solirubrobacteraceae bacterium]